VSGEQKEAHLQTTKAFADTGIAGDSPASSSAFTPNSVEPANSDVAFHEWGRVARSTSKSVSSKLWAEPIESHAS
jgi:hypothetical protein